MKSKVNQPHFFHASHQPEADIATITYPGQDYSRRMYRSGFNHFLNQMPIINPEAPMLQAKIDLSKTVMQSVAAAVKKDKHFKSDLNPGEGGFNRTVIAIESPHHMSDGTLEEGVELIVACWGNGFSSPVHGHKLGYLHEDILWGKMRVNTYRLLNGHSKIVRTISTIIATEGTFASRYTKPGGMYFKRQALIHNFTSIGFSGSLHYVPEHTRDGRDNQFEVEYFEDTFQLEATDLVQISTYDGMYLKIGDVCLVRSQNVPDYGDHFITITGPAVMKDHGLRPQDVVIGAPHAAHIFEGLQYLNGVILLKFKNKAKAAFHEFHNITITDGIVKFPTGEENITL